MRPCPNDKCHKLDESSGLDWRSGRVSDLGSMGCEFDHRWHQGFTSLAALGKLLTTNVHSLDPGVNGYLAKDSFYSAGPGIIVVAATGVYGEHGVETVKRVYQVRYKGQG